MRVFKVLLLAFGLIGYSGAGTAQDQVNSSGPLATEDAQPRKDRIENVIVRARKREEPVLSSPVTVTVLGGARLERQFAEDLADVGYSVPNVIIRPVSQFRAAMSSTIRGIGYGGINSEFDPPVAVFVDGFYYTRNTTALLDLFDIETIEILRGPQGTLFGRNAMAGAINVRTKRPSGEFGARANLRVGNHGRIDFRGSLDVPLVKDKVAAKLSVLSQNSSGYFRNVLDDGKRFGGDDLVALRPIIRFTPSDDFELTIIGEYSRDRGEPAPNKNASFPGQVLCGIVPANCVDNPWNYRHPLSPGHIPGDIRANANGEPYTIAFEQTAANFSNVWGVVAEAVWSTSAGTLTSITGYRDVDEQYEVDSEGDPFQFFNAIRPARVKDFSQELRYNVTLGKIDVIAGIYYLHSDVQTAMDVVSALGDAIASFRNSFQKRNSVALFADVEYHFSDQLSVNAGVRYTYEKKKFQFGAAIPRSAWLAGAPVPFTDINESWDDITPSVGIHYQLRDDLLIYATWSRGFKSGGFNALAASAPFAGPYDPEKVDGFEIGLKGDFLDDRLRVNLAGFYQLFEGLQRQIVEVIQVGDQQLTNNAIINAAEATTRGIELELVILPTDDLEFNLAVGFLDAFYRDFCADLGVTALGNPPPCDSDVPTAVDLSALKLVQAPEWQVTAGVVYSTDIGNAGFLTFAVDYHYSSPLESETGNDPIGHRRATHLVNASVRWEDASEQYAVSLFARNLFNSVYTLAGLDAGDAVWSVWVPSPPRVWGVEVDVRI